MRSTVILTCLLAFFSLEAGAGEAAPYDAPIDCSSKIQELQAAKALADVKLEEEMERADAQIYLTRLELNITKKKLAETAAKCGTACAPSASPDLSK